MTTCWGDWTDALDNERRAQGQAPITVRSLFQDRPGFSRLVSSMLTLEIPYIGPKLMLHMLLLSEL